MQKMFLKSKMVYFLVSQFGDTVFRPLIALYYSIKIAHLAGLGLLPAAGASARVEDPKVAAWMLQPSDKERNLSNLAMNFDHLTGSEVGFS